MSYGENVPPLDFTGIRFACLSGDNGNGKSAILDAITWTLFGETRAPREEDVMRRGTTDTQVTFDFAIEQNVYRVDRRRGKRGQSWELQIRQPDGNFRPLTGNHARDTKDKIRALLKMDYEMFLASGYVAQGRADQFTRIGSAKRKEILRDILNIGYYEKLEKMAKELHDEARRGEQDADREIAALDAALVKRRFHEECLTAAEARRNAHNDEYRSLYARYETLQQQIAGWESEEQRAKDLTQKIEEVQKENQNNERSLADSEQRILNARRFVNRKAQIDVDYARYTHLIGRRNELEEKTKDYFRVRRQIETLKETVAREEQKLDRERYHCQHDVEQGELEGRDLPGLTEEIAQLERQIAGFGDMEARLREADARWQEADERFSTLKTENAEVKAQLALLQERLQTLTEFTEAFCQFCGQLMSEEKRQQAIAETQTEMAQWNERATLLKTEGNRRKREVEEAKEEAKRLQNERLQREKLWTRQAQALQEQNRLQERASTLPQLRQRLNELNRILTERDFARSEQDELMRLTAKSERLERDNEECEKVREEISGFGDIERERLLLEQAEQIVREEPTKRDALAALIATKKEQIEKARQRVVAIYQKIAGLKESRRERDTLTGQLNAIRAEIHATEREIGQHQTNLDHLTQMADDRKRREEERKQFAKNREVYQELTAAFGKNGIQTLIIERALPDIQDDANELLAQMTSNAMRIELRTTREGKSKTTGQIETLDIAVFDELGERPYEMYSGGEAFRVNFALRIALAKLLARRAGAPLQTLILDEGFGTQDPRGREAIVEALNAVQEQFALILVITHIEELKDAFPTRIEVVKGPNGSTFNIV